MNVQKHPSQEGASRMFRKKGKLLIGVASYTVFLTLIASCSVSETKTEGDDEAAESEITFTTLSSVVGTGLMERLGLSQAQADYITDTSASLRLEGEDEVDTEEVEAEEVETKENDQAEAEVSTQAESSGDSAGAMIENVSELNKLEETDERYVSSEQMLDVVNVVVDEILAGQATILEGLTFVQYTYVMKEILDDCMVAVAKHFPEGTVDSSLSEIYGTVVESLEDWPDQSTEEKAAFIQDFTKEVTQSIEEWNAESETDMKFAEFTSKLFEYVSGISEEDQKVMLEAALTGAKKAEPVMNFTNTQRAVLLKTV
jgi:hypothetical protein